MSSKKTNKTAHTTRPSAKSRLFGFVDKFVVDNRSIDLFRVLLSAILLFDLIYFRLGWFDMFYSVDGIIPVTECYDASKVAFLSPYFWFKGDIAAKALMFISLGVYSLYFLGIGLKYVKPLAWFLHLSLMLRNVYVTYGFDFYTDHALFWAMFLPMGNYFLPQIGKLTKVKQAVTANPLVVFALVLQVFFLYIDTAAAKFGETWMQGYAVRNMVSDTFYYTPYKNIIVDNSFIYKSLNYGVLALEYIAPMLLLASFFVKRNFLRYTAIIMLLLLHIGIELFADIGTFSYISITVALLFLPSAFWDKFFARFKIVNPLAGIQVVKEKLPIYTKGLFVVVIAMLLLLNGGFLAFHTMLTKKLYPDNKKRYALDPINVPFRHLSICWQYWGMFAPNPIVDSGWINIEYVQKNSAPVDIFSMKEASATVPTYLPSGLEKMFLSFIRMWPQRRTQLKLLCLWADYSINKFKKERPEEAANAQIFVVPHQLYLGTVRKTSYVKVIPRTYTIEQLKGFLLPPPDGKKPSTQPNPPVANQPPPNNSVMAPRPNSSR